MAFPWYLWALLSAGALTITSVMEKKMLIKEHAMEFAATRSVFSLILVMLLIPFIQIDIGWKSVLLIFVLSWVVTIGLLYRFKAVRHLELSTVSPLMNLSSLFLLVIAYLVLGEVLSPLQLAGLFFIVGGAYFLEVSSHSTGLLEPFKRLFKSRHMIYVLLVTLAFSFTATIERLLITTQIEVFTYFFLLWLFLSLNFIVLDYVKFDLREIKHDLQHRSWRHFFCAFFHFIAALFYFKALSMAFVTLVVPIKRLSTLATTVVGGKMFHEERVALKSVACVLMIFGTVLIVL